MSIKQSMLLGLIAFLIALALNSYVGYSSTGELSAKLDYITGKAWNTADGAMEGQIELEKQIIIVNRLQQKQLEASAAKADMTLAVDRANEALNRMAQQELISAEQSRELNERLAAFKKVREQVFADLLAGNIADSGIHQFNLVVGELLAFITELEEVADGKVESETENIAALVSGAKMQLGLGFLFAVAIAVVIFYVSVQFILKPIAFVTEQLDQLSVGTGDLTSRLPQSAGSTEMGRLANAFNAFVQKLQQMIGHVQTSNLALLTASTQISHSIETTSHVANAQFGEISLVVNAVQKISHSLNHVGEAANRANVASEQAVHSTQTGNQIVGLAQQGVDQVASEIDKAAQVIAQLVTDSQNISAMLEVIRSIAEQTNLLALNAAIEAARAGETGRGFAVVADEVRSLASRTQESTKSIEGIIANLSSGSTRAVEAMSSAQSQAVMIKERIGKTSDAFSDIVAVVEQIKDMNANIARASDDEQQDMKDINKSMNNILSQARNNQEAGQSAKTARQHLEEQVTTIDGLLKQFKT